MKKIAVIDLGSNSARMTVSAIDGISRKILYNKSVNVRLSDGITDKSNTLKLEPMLRAIMTLKEFADTANKMCVEDIYLLATEAVRRADNHKMFTNIVKEHTGLDVIILSGDDEAYYDCIAAAAETGLSDFVMVDTGGGSTEIALVRFGKMTNSVSLPWGAVTLNSVFSENGNLSIREYRRAAIHIADGLSSVDWLSSVSGMPVAALGGSLRIYGRLGGNDDITQFSEKILRMTYDERIAFGIPATKADVITAGLLPAVMLSAMLNPERFIVCKGGVSDGFIISKTKEF